MTASSKPMLLSCISLIDVKRRLMYDGLQRRTSPCEQLYSVLLSRVRIRQEFPSKPYITKARLDTGGRRATAMFMACETLCSSDALDIHLIYGRKMSIPSDGLVLPSTYTPSQEAGYLGGVNLRGQGQSVSPRAP